MEKRRVFINAATSIAQVVVLTGTTFLLYRVVLRVLGAEDLGVWSLALALLSLAGVAGIGLSGALVKYAAKHSARGDTRAVADVIGTAFGTTGIVMGVALLFTYFCVRTYLQHTLDATHLLKAQEVLPIAALCTWFLVVGNVLTAALDGLQRFWMRNLLMMVIGVVHLLIAIPLISRYGLWGLAIAALGQHFARAIAAYCLVSQATRNPLFAIRWRMDQLRLMVSYGLSFQVISVTKTLLDPLTKALLQHFGSLESVAYYEIANKLGMQLQAAILAAVRVLVPVIAGLKESARQRSERIFVATTRITSYVAVPAFALVGLCTPLLCQILVAKVEPLLVLFAVMLLLGRLSSVLAGAAYVVYLGNGRLGWIIVGHIVIGGVNLLLGVPLGYLCGGIGVVAACSVALLAGNAVYFVAYLAETGLPLSAVLRPEDKRVWLSALLACVIAVAVFLGPGGMSVLSRTLCGVGLFVLVMTPAMWRYSLRERAVAAIFRGVSGRIGSVESRPFETVEIQRTASSK